MRPDGKARRVRIPGVFERGATQPGGMQRRPNAVGLSPRADQVRGAWTGWINVVVAAVIMLATFPGRTQGLGLITEPMLRDLHLDRVTYANINLWATLLGAAICLPVGRLFDRVGLRRATFVLVALLGGVVWTMSRLAGAAFALFLLVLATRALGQSALSVASITAVGKSFDRRVGVAMGVYSVLLSLLFAAAFVAVGNAVRVSGWRTAWAQVAIGLVLFAAPTVLLLRERPAHQPSDPADTGLVDDGLSLAAALRTPAFWVFGGATSLFGLVSSGLGLFNEAVLAERGFDQQTVRHVHGRHLDHRPGRSACVRVAHAPWVDAAPARPGDVPLLGGARGPAASHDPVPALDLRRPDRGIWRHDYRALLRGLEAGVWSGAPGPHPGRRADADGPRVRNRTAPFRAVRGVDRVVHTCALDAGAVRASAERRSASRADTRFERCPAGVVKVRYIL